MANHASIRTTQLYDRRADEVTLDDVERVSISTAGDLPYQTRRRRKSR